MFTIIGGDGKEYGPVSVDQVRAWITAGRANLETKAKALGSEEWRPLGEFSEFNGGATPPLVPPAVGFAPTAAAPAAASATAAAELAERGRRLGARAIDWALEFIAAIPGGAILGTEFLKLVMMVSQGKEPDLEQLDKQRLLLGAGVLAGTWLVLLVIQVWMLSTRSQSIGKRLVGIRIVRFSNGAPAGFVHAWLLRELSLTVIGIVLGLLPFIGPTLFRPAFHLTDWCLIFRDDRRCLHDLMADTKVVRA